MSSAKAIASAIVVLLVVLLRKFWPDVADGGVQEAIRVLLELLISASVVWLVPNKGKV